MAILTETFKIIAKPLQENSFKTRPFQTLLSKAIRKKKLNKTISNPTQPFQSKFNNFLFIILYSVCLDKFRVGFQNPRAIACPVIEAIDFKTFQYKVS
jgi:hypothetical protein